MWSGYGIIIMMKWVWGYNCDGVRLYNDGVEWVWENLCESLILVALTQQCTSKSGGPGLTLSLSLPVY